MRYKAIVLAILAASILLAGCLQPPDEIIMPTPAITPQETPTPTPIFVLPTFVPQPEAKKLPSDALWISARMLKPSYWGPGRYGLDSLKVEIYNQMTTPVTFRAQIISGTDILEERTITLENQGSSVSFPNEKRYFVTSPNITLRIIVPGYKSMDYKFTEVASLS